MIDQKIYDLTNILFGQGSWVTWPSVLVKSDSVMKVRTNFYICKPGLVFHQLFHFSFVYLVVENKIKIPNLGEPSCPFKISGPGVEYRRIRLEDGQEHQGARVQLNNAQDLQIAFYLIGSKFSGNLFLTKSIREEKMIG
jgi:hypothetical protein